MRIIEASPSDVAALERLERVCFSMYRLSARQIRYLLRRPTAIVLVAKEGGEVVGDAVGLVRRSGSARVYSIAVDPKHRGRGIGKILLQKLLRRMWRRGVTKISLEVEKRNRAAIGLYEKFGFAIARVLPDYYGEGRAGVRMSAARSRRVNKKS